MKNLCTSLLIVIFVGSLLFSQDAERRERPKVGLVLSGGGALGFAHIGALKVIDSLGIPIDYVAGTSFGGLMTGLYSIGYRSDSLQKIVEDVDWNDIFHDTPKRDILPFAEKKYTGRYYLRLPLKGFTPTPPGGAIAGQKISLFFSRLTYQYANVMNFDSLPIPFRCVGVDLITGHQVVIDKGPLSRAMRATMAIPSAFTPVEYGDSLLSDGGLLNNFPVDVLKKMGADIVIGVDVSGYKFSREDAQEMFKILDRAASIPRYQRLAEFVSQTDIYIQPNLDEFGIADFENSAIQEISHRGYVAAQSMIDTLSGLKRYLDSFGTDTSANTRISKQSQELFIHGVDIQGNEQLNFSFIYTLLNISPGSLFSTEIMDRKITEAYALGYFETISYAISMVNDSSANVIITVKERPFRELNIGLRYDDYYQMVGIVGLRMTNVFLAGARFESELEFAGLFRTWGKLSYPTLSLDVPIYPYFIARYKDVPLDIYLPSLTVQFKERAWSVGLGLGFTFDKHWSVEAEFDHEMTSLESKTFVGLFDTKQRQRYLSSAILFDEIDDVFIPRRGMKAEANIEHSAKTFGSDFDYTRLSARLEYYITPVELHTLALKGALYRIYDNAPLYKDYYIGGPNEFVGANYMQINGTRLAIARLDYRYEFKKDIFLKAIFNFLIDPDILSPIDPAATRTKIGFGMGVMFDTIIGPIELIFAQGEKSFSSNDGKQNIVHFTAGMKF